MGYQISNGLNGKPSCVVRARDSAFVPFNTENRDCVQFLTDWKAGAEVLNADGSPVPYSDDAVRALGLEP
jgi:hypothetical protein